jgi:hypothetical protein
LEIPKIEAGLPGRCIDKEAERKTERTCGIRQALPE